jgi:hypothetical protein
MYTTIPTAMANTYLKVSFEDMTKALARFAADYAAEIESVGEKEMIERGIKERLQRSTAMISDLNSTLYHHTIDIQCTAKAIEIFEALLSEGKTIDYHALYREYAREYIAQDKTIYQKNLMHNAYQSKVITELNKITQSIGYWSDCILQFLEYNYATLKERVVWLDKFEKTISISAKGKRNEIEKIVSIANGYTKPFQEGLFIHIGESSYLQVDRSESDDLYDERCSILVDQIMLEFRRSMQIRMLFPDIFPKCEKMVLQNWMNEDMLRTYVRNHLA